jgi:putative ABC transport system permease protein
MLDYLIKIKRRLTPFYRDGWVWKMAWRDARHNFSRLFLFAASLITGIAGVVSIASLNISLQDELDRNARELLGADLVVSTTKKFEPEILTLFDSTKGEQALSSEMFSMVYFSESKQSRLISLNALGGNFPFYGEVETDPPGALETMKKGGYALIDEPLAVQYSVSANDTLKLGNSYFIVAGYVRKFPGGSGILATFNPSVYISHADLDSTGLVQFGSRVTKRRYFKTATEADAEKLEDKFRPTLKKFGHRVETVEGRKEDLGEGFQSIYKFFSLLAFIALILGCIGVASSVHIYAREKRDEVAVLRCVGSSGWQAFSIYFIQIFWIGLAASLIGAALGAGIQQFVPVLFKDFIPGNLHFELAWQAVVVGVLLGIIVSLLFSGLPLLMVRFVPPLQALRADTGQVKKFSRARLFVISLTVLFPFLAAAYQTDWLSGSMFTVGLAAVIGLLALVALGMLKLARRAVQLQTSFVFRHALSNLFRPNNQTQTLLVSIGLGALIISVLNITRSSLLAQVEFTGSENQSNTILFDIQPHQKDGVVKTITDNDFKANQVVPIVTCRIREVNGRSVPDIQKDTTDNIRDWSLTREYRVTYRDSLTHSEELIEGKVQYIHPLPREKQSKNDSIYVTISEGMHENLNLKIGDSLVFDVQGILVKVFLSGIRKVDWPIDPPNFIFVFPKGSIDDAPQIWVAATRIDESPKATKFQQELITFFPNVSMFDLRLLLSTINSIFEKVGMVVRFLALFSIITGLIVLAGAVMNSKYVRMKENVLLRTIGARSKQITFITLLEYAYLGLFASVAGVLLSVGAGWLLCRFFFDVTFSADWLELLITIVAVATMTMLIGWFNSREVINSPPLQVLRKES